MRELTPQRSESDIVLKKLTLHFGEKDYDVPVLRVAASAEWRKKFFELTAECTNDLPQQFDEHSPHLGKALANGLFAALLRFPEKIPDLVFSYAPDLPKEEILASAYDQEFALAFKAIWRVAFEPFLASLGMVMEMQRATNSPSAQPTN
jgi:hypothetical protein